MHTYQRNHIEHGILYISPDTADLGFSIIEFVRITHLCYFPHEKIKTGFDILYRLFLALRFEEHLTYLTYLRNPLRILAFSVSSLRQSSLSDALHSAFASGGLVSSRIWVYHFVSLVVLDFERRGGTYSPHS